MLKRLWKTQIYAEEIFGIVRDELEKSVLKYVSQFGGCNPATRRFLGLLNDTMTLNNYPKTVSSSNKSY